jgi:hypothetical protein
MKINLNSLVVRPITAAEENTWDELMATHHYLGFRTLVGESLKYVAQTPEGKWVALLGWGCAAFKNRHRDAWIGWSEEQKEKRLKFIVNNQRFLVLPGCSVPNLASKVLAENTRRLFKDWREIYGHPVLVAETFVDHHRFAGTCYRAAGWLPLGKTSGYGKNARVYYYHGQTKTIFVLPLHKKARQILSAPFLPPELNGGEKALVDLNTACLPGLLEHLATVSDPRKKRGIRHPQASILAVAVCALLSGAKSFVAIGEWAAGLSQDILRRLGCRYSPRLKRYVPPSEPTLRRTLQSVDAQEVDQAVGIWLFSQGRNGQAVAIDGKTLRGSKGAGKKPVCLVAAFLQKEKIVIGQREVDQKTNEIAAFRPLLEPLPLEGKVVTADALHTQAENARFVVEAKKADYLFPVKQNQRNLYEAIKDLAEEDFSPSVHNGGQRPRKG